MGPQPALAEPPLTSRMWQELQRRTPEPTKHSSNNGRSRPEEFHGTSVSDGIR